MENISNKITDNDIVNERLLKAFHTVSELDVSRLETVVTTIDSVKALKYKHDFYGLLEELKVGEDLKHITTLINSLNSSREYDGKTLEIRLISNTNVNLALSIISKARKDIQ